MSCLLCELEEPGLFQTGLFEVENVVCGGRPANHDRCFRFELPVDCVVAIGEPDFAERYAILELVVVFVSIEQRKLLRTFRYQYSKSNFPNAIQMS